MSEKENKNINKADDNFSIEKELADMKKSLLVEDDNDNAIISDAINSALNEKKQESEAKEPKETQASKDASQLVNEETPKEEKASSEEAPVKETQDKPKEEKTPKTTSAKTTTKKAPAKKSSSTKKKPLTEAQKLAKKEKERLAKEKEKAKRREAVKKAKEKEKTRLAVQQAKEKEKARLEALIKREKEKSEARAIARKAAEEKLASLESEKKANELITSDLDDVKPNKDFAKDSGLEKIGPKKVAPTKKQQANKEENVSESLQRLREQIAAKKDLEQRIMDGKMAKEASDKTNELKENIKELEAKNKDLKDKLAKAQAEVKEVSNISEDEQLAKLREEIASLEKKVNELEAANNLVTEENNRLKEDAKSLEENLKNQYSIELEAKDTELASLKNRYEADIDRLNQEAMDKEKANAAQMANLEKALNKEFNAKSKAADKENAKALAAKQKENDQVNKELTNTKIQLTKANNALLSKQNELDEAKNDLNQKLVLANEEIGLLKRDLDVAKDRNVKDADTQSEVEELRNKLVEQSRELEKNKKELELQESYLNLYKQEIDAKAAEAVKEANDELAKYKANNVVKEDEIRASEQAKYQELEKEYNEVSNNLNLVQKEHDNLELKVKELDDKLASSNDVNNRLNSDNDRLNEEIKSLNERLQSLKDGSGTTSSSEELEALRKEISEKDVEIANLRLEMDNAKENFEREKEAFRSQSEAIDKQLDEMLKGVLENENSIANTALIIENYREALENEKNAHLEAEQQLYDSLREKDEEISKLHEAIKQNKLDSQINQITNMVQDLSRRDMFGPRPPYQSQYYGSYEGYRDPYDAKVSDDRNREIAKRDEIIASLQKERKQEVDSLNAKIEALEAQIRDLNEALIKQQSAKSVSVDYVEVNEYASKIKALLATDNLDGFSNLNDLLDAYQSAKKKEDLVYTNECDKLNIANKYVNDDNIKATINAKKEFLNDHYAKVLKELDANLEKAVNDMKKKDVANSPIVTPLEVRPVVVSVEDTAPASMPAEERVPEEVASEVKAEPDGDIVSDEAPIYDSYEEKAEELERLEPLEAKQTPLIKQEEKQTEVVITFDSEYLNKLNNIRRTRKSLEERKVIETANHKIELSNNESLQKEYARKIDELKDRIDELTASFQAQSDHSDEATNKFEIEKQKLFYELTSRQSQLNKLSDDDVRKINLRYHNIIKGIEDQLLRLEEEEKDLRDTYVLKQKKEESRLSREAALNKQFEDANVNRSNEVEEERVLESQDEIRERKFRSRYEGLVSSQPRKLIDDKDVASIVVNDKGDVVSGIDAKPVDKEEVKEVLNDDLDDIKPVEEAVVEEAKIDVSETKISPKEIELRKKYESFCNAEKVYSNDIASVREYKKLKEQYLALDQAISENNDKISGLNEILKASNDATEIANVKNQISELKAKSDNLKNNRDYAKRQVNDASKDKHVKDYNKLIQKIEDAANILKKYQAKRDKKAK